MTIHLAHFSVRQYILCKMPAQDGLLLTNERLRIANEAAQSNILSKLCLRYLNTRSVWQQPLRLADGPVGRPFLDYSASSWNEHVKTDGSNYRTVATLINAFFDVTNPSWESWRNWVESKDSSSTTAQQTDVGITARPLFYA